MYNDARAKQARAKGRREEKKGLQEPQRRKEDLASFALRGEARRGREGGRARLTMRERKREKVRTRKKEEEEEASEEDEEEGEEETTTTTKGGGESFECRHLAARADHTRRRAVLNRRIDSLRIAI